MSIYNSGTLSYSSLLFNISLLIGYILFLNHQPTPPPPLCYLNIHYLQKIIVLNVSSTSVWSAVWLLCTYVVSYMSLSACVIARSISTMTISDWIMHRGNMSFKYVLRFWSECLQISRKDSIIYLLCNFVMCFIWQAC